MFIFDNYILGFIIKVFLFISKEVLVWLGYELSYETLGTKSVAMWSAYCCKRL